MLRCCKLKMTTVMLVSTVIFSVLLILGLGGDQFGTYAELEEPLQRSGAEIAPEVAEALEGLPANEPIEVLVLLKDQADTTAAAAKAKQVVPAHFSAHDRKMAARYAVVDALAETAAQTQKPMLSYLAKEQTRHSVEEYKSFYIVNIVYVRANASVIENLARRPEVDKILPNAEVKLIEPVKDPDLDDSKYYHDPSGDEITPSSSGVEWNVERVKAPQVWDQGIEGSGVVVGIIDTGVDWTHEALKEKWRGYDSENPDTPNSLYNWLDVVNEQPDPTDNDGHGTHVAGSVLGSDPGGNNIIGVAPGARWIAVNAFGDQGTASSDDLLTAGEYMLAPYDPEDPEATADPTKAPDIINNSWGGGSEINEWYRPMVQNWREVGILPVFAAGNDGPAGRSIVVPANYPDSFAVAATKSDNLLADFSSRGPAPYPYPQSLKPNISAPGVSIRSAIPGNSYSNKQGTSMAAPHIAGVAALLLDNNPGLSVEEIENKIVNSAQPLSDDDYPSSPNIGYGYGLVDAFAAISAASTAPPLPPPPYSDETAYAWNVDTMGSGVAEGPVTVTIPSGGLDKIKTESTVEMTGADFVGSDWYAVSDESPSKLYFINITSGDYTLVGSTEVEGMTGLAYDPDDQVLYGAAYDDGQSTLYSVATSTAEVDEIGQIGEGLQIAGIAFDTGGILYGLNLNDDSLYTIDQDNGNTNLIGPVGYSLTGTQDIAYDRGNNVLYGTLYDSDSDSGGLYVFNPANGASTLLYDFEARVAAFAVPYMYSEDFAGGSGTEEDPYQVATAAQLNRIRSFSSDHFEQVADIDLGVSPWNSGSGWEPFGSFSGSYDGSGYEITDLTIKRPHENEVGLFGRTESSAELSNINLVDISVHGFDYVGGLVGYNRGRILDSSTSGDVDGEAYIGGLAGISYADIKRCSSSCNVTGVQVNRLWFSSYGVGGLVGRVEGGNIVDSHASGAVTGNGAVGGLIGTVFVQAIYDPDSGIIRCYSTGTVNGIDPADYNTWFYTQYIGGLIGHLRTGYLVNSYSTASVNSIRRSSNSPYSITGGLVGYSWLGVIHNCYAAGSVELLTGSQEIEGQSLTFTISGIGSDADLQYLEEAVTQAFAGSVSNSSALSFSTRDEAYGETGNIEAVSINVFAPGNDFHEIDLEALKISLVKDLPGFTITNFKLDSGSNGEGFVGGLVGLNEETVINSYYDQETTGQSDEGSGIPKTTAGMKAGFPSEEIYDRWDNTVWTFSTAGEYPQLGEDPDPGAYDPQPPLPEGDFAGGSGTEGDPYRVAGAQDLDHVRYKPEAHFIQTADIDLSGLEWEPIGDGLFPFDGVYDGNGFSITNLQITIPANYRGLFGYAGESSKLKNITLEDADVTGRYFTGGLVGRSDYYVSGSSVSGTVIGHQYVGGLVGSMGRSGSAFAPFLDNVLSELSSSASVTGANYVGGLVGFAHADMTDSSATGSVELLLTDVYDYFVYPIGGLAGNLSRGSVSNSFATGDIEALRSAYAAGALIGYARTSSDIIVDIQESYASGNVYCRAAEQDRQSYAGGLIGRVLISGDSASANVNNCFSTGNLFFTVQDDLDEGISINAGGLIGSTEGHVLVESSYATGNVEFDHADEMLNYANNYIKLGGLLGTNGYVVFNLYFSSRGEEVKNSFATGSINGGSAQGGLVAGNAGTVFNSYSVGRVEGSDDKIGGLIGISEGDIINSYYDQDTSGQNDTGKGIPKSRTEMLEGVPSPELYTDWSDEVWTFSPDDSYPWLDEPYSLYLVSISVSPEGSGSISGYGGYSAGSEVSVTATANTGYEFVNWTENGTQVSADPTFTFTVTEDRDLVATFTDVKATDAYLSALEIDPGTLDPAFEPGTNTYTAEVTHDTGSIDVTATLSDPEASMTIDEEEAICGEAVNVDLNEPGSETIIEIIVTAQDNQTDKTYTITVNRAEDLSGADLALEKDPITEGEPARINITNAKDSAGDPIEGADVPVTVTSDQGEEGEVFNDSVDFSSPAGEAQIETDSLNTTGTHNLTVTIEGITADIVVALEVEELSTDADLSALEIDPGTLDPAFDPGTTNYTAEVTHDTGSIDVTATLSDPEASMTINGDEAYSGESETVMLGNPGTSTEIDIVITAVDGDTTKTYTITVTRAAGPSEPTWANISPTDAQVLAAGKGVLTASFDGIGIGLYSGNWELLTSANAVALATDGNNIVASVENFGTWLYDGDWHQLTNITAQLLAVDNGIIAASFDDHGIWLYDNGWTNLTPASAKALDLDNGKLVVSVDGYGIWLYDGEWSNLTAETADIVALDDNKLAASFTDHGIWLYDGEWENLTPVSAKALFFDDGIIVASVDGFGVWLNDGEWNNIINYTADLLALGGGKVAASFEEHGVWLYE